ncbi:MAG: hypothetical protein IIT50_07780, partial [Bacteroidales bacterium]|nr:hypothetical protein [Bacteroidales bacterium]
MRALISVSDKRGVADFAAALSRLGWEIIATGGTQRLLEQEGVKTIGISEVTGFPEICDGRVKTLHPKVHGALLGRRDLPSHLQALRENGIEFIDLVCVNLYPFAATIAKPGVTMEDAVENTVGFNTTCINKQNGALGLPGDIADDLQLLLGITLGIHLREVEH